MSTGNPTAEAVLVEQRDRVLIVTINRPEARNAINAEVTSGVAAAMDRLDGSKDLSIGVLTGAGGTTTGTTGSGPSSASTTRTGQMPATWSWYHSASVRNER